MDETNKTEVVDADHYVNESKKDAYYLALTNSPHFILTYVQVKEDNYDEWIKMMQLGLHAKKKLDFAEELIQKPKAGTNKEEEWWTINTMVGSWISNTI